MSSNYALIAYGANLSLGNFTILEHSESIFREPLLQEAHKSRFFETPSFPAGSGPNFINAAISIRTDLNADALLEQLHQIENKFARKRPYRWSPRSCDLDLLFFNDDITPDRETWQKYATFSTQEAMDNIPDRLILPHPRLHERAFVLAPLLDIAPDFIHPVYQKSIKMLWEQLPQALRDEPVPI